MTWTVCVPRKVLKDLRWLPVEIRAKLAALMAEIETMGPVRGNWPNYGKLDANVIIAT